MNAAQLPALLFLVPFGGTLLVPFAARVKASLPRLTACASMLAASALSLFALWHLRGGETLSYKLGGWAPPVGIEWHLDSLSALMILLVSAVAFGVLFSTSRLSDEQAGRARVSYYTAVMLVLSGLIGMLLTHDLFNLFVFLEVSSLASYALIAAGPSARGKYASLKYLLLGSLGASFYLLGVGYLYAKTGTLNMTDMAVRLDLLGTDRNVTLGVLFIFLGLSIKMGLFPFHGWLPDAYTYASNPVTALLAPVMTKVAIYAMIRIALAVFGIDLSVSFHLFFFLKMLGIAAILGGSLLAFVQTDLKKMLAYSSISHIGLIALGISLHSRMALSGVVLHIVSHALMKACLFLIVCGLADRHGITTVSELSRMRGRMPWTGAFLILAALSMTGVPPLAGFFSTWYILNAAMINGQWLTAGAIAGASLLTALYFFRVIEQACFGKTETAPVDEEVPGPLLAVTGTLAVSLIAIGLAAPFLYRWISETFFPGLG